MKKFVAVLLTAIILCSAVMPLGAFASYSSIKQNDPILLPNSSPVIDGNIKASDGWSKYAVLNDAYAKYTVYDTKMETSLKIYTAFDKNGLYFAADIYDPNQGENSFVYSTGPDEFVENNGEVGVCGVNGDVFVFTVDPLGVCRRAGYIDINDYTPWYCVGLYKNDVPVVYRTRVNKADITSSVKVKGHKTTDGWCFECMLPWTVIIKDVKAATLGAVENLTVEQLTAPGSQFLAAAIYADRFDDIEVEELNTINRFMTAPTITVRGDYSYKLTGDYSTLNGLYLYIGDIEPNYTDISKNAWYYQAAAYTYSRKLIEGDQYLQHFMPEHKLTREMFVAILARMSGEDISSYKTSRFKDVPNGQWYTESIGWAADNGLVYGITETTFGLGKAVTREQAAKMIMGYAKYRKKNITMRADLSRFTDSNQISDWAYDAISWMVFTGYMCGTSSVSLSPREDLTRAQGAELIYKCYPDFSMNLFS